jgi:peptide/nickel transport system ATP-binding protein
LPELQPMCTIADGHIVKCHLTDADLDEMEPVISLAG